MAVFILHIQFVEFSSSWWRCCWRRGHSFRRQVPVSTGDTCRRTSARSRSWSWRHADRAWSARHAGRWSWQTRSPSTAPAGRRKGWQESCSSIPWRRWNSCRSTSTRSPRCGRHQVLPARPRRIPVLTNKNGERGGGGGRRDIIASDPLWDWWKYEEQNTRCVFWKDTIHVRNI